MERGKAYEDGKERGRKNAKASSEEALAARKRVAELATQAEGSSPESQAWREGYRDGVNA